MCALAVQTESLRPCEVLHMKNGSHFRVILKRLAVLGQGWATGRFKMPGGCYYILLM